MEDFYDQSVCNLNLASMISVNSNAPLASLVKRYLPLDPVTCEGWNEIGWEKRGLSPFWAATKANVRILFIFFVILLTMLVFIFTCSKKTRQGIYCTLYQWGLHNPLVANVPIYFFWNLWELVAPFLTSCVVFGGIQFPTFPCLTKLVRIPACVCFFSSRNNWLSNDWQGQTSHFFGISKRSGFEMSLFGNPLSSVPLSKKWSVWLQVLQSLTLRPWGSH